MSALTSCEPGAHFAIREGTACGFPIIDKAPRNICMAAKTGRPFWYSMGHTLIKTVCWGAWMTQLSIRS